MMHKHCNIGSTNINSFSQQTWLAYENFFFESYTKKLLKLYQVLCQYYRRLEYNSCVFTD